VANYTGDVFNFGLACEKAKKMDNINVRLFGKKNLVIYQNKHLYLIMHSISGGGVSS